MKKPLVILLYFMMSVFGFLMVILGSAGLVDKMYNILLGMTGGMMMFMSFLILFSGVMGKKLWNFFTKLKPGEKLEFQVDRGGHLLAPIIVETKHEGVSYARGKGWIEEKSQPLECWTGQECQISLRKMGRGITFDPKMGGYFTFLRQEKALPDYESALRTALGEDLYAKFCKHFRDFKKKPRALTDVYDIQRELYWLIQQKMVDKLETEIFGEEVDVYDMLVYLQWAYDPCATENAIERERIIAREEALSYKGATKALTYAIAAVIIIIGCVIAVYMLGNVDFGKMFGGVAKALPATNPPAVISLYRW